jgi:hypothetical protein
VLVTGPKVVVAMGIEVLVRMGKVFMFVGTREVRPTLPTVAAAAV